MQNTKKQHVYVDVLIFEGLNFQQRWRQRRGLDGCISAWKFDLKKSRSFKPPLTGMLMVDFRYIVLQTYFVSEPEWTSRNFEKEFPSLLEDPLMWLSADRMSPQLIQYVFWKLGWFIA